MPSFNGVVVKMDVRQRVCVVLFKNSIPHAGGIDKKQRQSEMNCDKE